MDSSTLTSWKAARRQYDELPESNQCQVTYIWIDGSQQNLRAKSRNLDKEPTTPEDLPPWSFCGYGTYMADSAKDSEMVMIPVALYPDPFRRGNSKLALCDTYCYNKIGQLKPTFCNKRYQCKKSLDRAFRLQCWFGIEQEYTLLDRDLHPLGWPKLGYPAPMGPYYCGVGAGKAICRDIVEAHYKCMLYAGIGVYGINAEASPAQWEWQMKPLSGLEAADQLWISRFMLHRVAEDFGVIVSLDPKPIAGNWNGSGVHVNFSTKEMREDGGFSVIEEACEKLCKKHEEHIKVYDPRGGEDNKRRLTGAHETANIQSCTTGIGDRTVSIRIPREIAMAKKGYLEDRRPSSNCDPYDVIKAMVDTCCLE